MTPMLERLRPAFLGRSRREKLLAALFVVVLAVIWAGNLMARSSRFSTLFRSTQRAAGNQELILENRERIEQRHQEALTLLRNTELPTGSQVYAKIDELARKYFVQQQGGFRFDPLQSVTRENLTFHTITLSASRAPYNQLRSFYHEVLQSLPTVNLDEITFSAPDRRTDALEGRFKFVAIEINR